MKRLIAGILPALAVLIGASVAEAHTVSASADCSQTKITYTNFASSGAGGGGQNKVYTKVTTNGGTVADLSNQFPGSGTVVTVPNPLFNGDVVRVRSSWKANETRDGHARAESEILVFTATRCGDRPPPPTCENTPSLCPPPPPSCENTPSLCPPPPAPPPVPPEIIPPPAEPEYICPTMDIRKFKITKKGHFYTLRGKNLSKFRWRVDGRLIGKKRTVRVRNFNRHIVEVRALVNECQKVRLTKQLPKRPDAAPPVPRFTG